MPPPRSNPQLNATDRAAQRLAMLQELSEIGMELARGLRTQALAAPEAQDEAPTPKVTPGDPVLMFTRVARAVRQTLALEMRLSQPEPMPNPARWREEALAGRERRKAQVREIARAVVAADGPAAERDRLFEAVDARLESDGAWDEDEDYSFLPLSALVASICAELGVDPDWSRWAGADWALDEARVGLRGSVFAAHDAHPPDDDDPAGLGPPRSTGPPWADDRRGWAS